MGKHSTPEGEKSTSEKMQGTRDQDHNPKHAAPEKNIAGSDLPHRDGRSAEH